MAYPDRLYEHLFARDLMAHQLSPGAELLSVLGVFYLALFVYATYVVLRPLRPETCLWSPRSRWLLPLRLLIGVSIGSFAAWILAFAVSMALNAGWRLMHPSSSRPPAPASLRDLLVALCLVGASLLLARNIVRLFRPVRGSC